MALRPRIRPLGSLNERLVALEIVRQVLALRYSLHLRDMVVRAINDTEEPVARLIRDGLRGDAGLRDPAGVRNLQRLIDQLNAMRATAWQTGRTAVTEELETLAVAEAEDQRSLFGWLLPGVSLALPAASLLRSRAVTTPFQGRTVSRWFVDAAEDDARRVSAAVSTGAALGETPEQVARRVVGTASQKGSDGATQTSRNHVDTIARSAVTHVVSQSRDAFYDANAGVTYQPRPDPPTSVPPIPPTTGGVEVFLTEQFVAVLDSRTTKLCRGLDGKRYKLGVGPIPPLHMRCRSLRVLVLPESLGGPVHDPGTYAQWVRAQPEEVLVLLMGTSMATKMRKGKVDVGAFTDYGSRPMTLDEVREAARKVMEAY